MSSSGTDRKLEIWVCFGVILSLDGFYVRVFTRLGNLWMIWDWFRNRVVPFCTSQTLGKNWGFLDGLVRVGFVGKLGDCY